MKNIGLLVEYDGSKFHGWQRQLNQRTVEGELKKALDRATGEDIQIISSGRTDKGVHALGQFVNFKTSADIPGENYKLLMDYLLPEDISIKDSLEMDPDFHSRFDAVKRRYRYIVYNRKLPNALVRNFSYFFPYDLDLNKMREASKYFLGEHDFTAFRLADNSRVNPVRKIYRLDIIEDGDFIEFIIEANAFLHNMVRIIVGTLLYVGWGKLEVNSIDEILASKDRKMAGITAGAEGLYLEKVFYK